jgi:hypothetical protein
MMREVIIDSEPTNALTVVDVFIGRIGARIVKCPNCDVNIVPSSFLNKRVLLISQSCTTKFAKTAINAWSRLKILDIAFNEPKPGFSNPCPSHGNRATNTRA